MKVRGIPLGDAEIRAALLDSLHHQHSGESDVVFLEELGLCRGQGYVDVAVVNRILHGYEIKSDRDSLRRLAGQVVLYGRVLDRATVVVATRHRDEVDTLVPSWWEIVAVDGQAGAVRFRRHRRGRTNPARDDRALVELLWLDEALELLEARDALRGYRSKPRREVWDRVCELYKGDEIADAVRQRLRARTAQRSLQRCA